MNAINILDQSSLDDAQEGFLNSITSISFEFCDMYIYIFISQKS